jgi:lipopolysaccharide/colanic/teichoic acid biosynthesis glycosyltransferase
LNSEHTLYRRIGKRWLDLGLAAVSLLILAPVFLVIAISIKVGGKGPIFYSQERVGRNGRFFRIWKFRSMVVGADRVGPGITSADDRRITVVGRFLRSWKLDELPQLWNILRGDMSFVGPRPELFLYVKDYNEEQRRVLWARPGVTDLASVEYRNEEALLAAAPEREHYYREVVLPHKLALGRKYIEHISLRCDCLLILRTFAAILGFNGQARFLHTNDASDKALVRDESNVNRNI